MKKLYIIMISIIIALGCIILIQPKVNAADEEGNLVIVLDPGHGGNDPGAANGSYGLQEAYINYRIAAYCKEELEKYEGVKVYLTRYADCPSIYERGEFAKNYQADLVVSIHINSSPSSSARGAEIWVTQDNTRIEYYEKSKELGWNILSQLSNLGIKNNGVSTRSGKADEWYESGVVKDYYGIIRYPMNYGIRSILVEHCYISNSSDCQFINSEAKLKNLGVADATGIAEAYKLNRKGEGKESVRKLALDKTEINLEITSDDPEPLNFLYPVFTPSNPYNQEVDYYSSNPEVVRAWGERIRGLKEGEATITAISRNNQRIAKCRVVVTKPEIPLQEITTDTTQQTVNIDETGDIIINFNPSNASDKTLYWESSEPEIVRIWNGHFRGLKEGKSIITATSRAGGKKVSCEVTVKDHNKAYVESINVEQEEYVAEVNDAVDILFSYTPEDAINAEFYWTSSNDEILRVWGNRFRALKPGTAEVIVRTLDGTVEKRIPVTVKNPGKVETINISKTEYEIAIDEAVDISYGYSPKNATNAEFDWISSNPEVIRVFGNRFRGLKEGTAEVIVKTVDGSIETRIKVTVKDATKIKVENINFEQTEYVVKVNDAVDIPFSYTPENATNAEFYWTSSNDEILRVWGNRFRALKPGTAEVIVETLDGSLEARVRVTVEQ